MRLRTVLRFAVLAASSKLPFVNVQICTQSTHNNHQNSIPIADKIYVQTMASILQMLGDFPKVCDS
jgi:hypothetical protein